MSSLIGSALLAALILSMIWWIVAVNKETRRRKERLDERNNRIDAHYQRNLQRARELGVITEDWHGKAYHHSD